MRLKSVYKRLFKVYGPQAWWPADSRFEVMLGAILTQNTAWSNVEKALINLKANDCLSAECISNKAITKLANWLKPSGYFNIKAQRLQHFCRWFLDQGGYASLNRLSTEHLRERLLGVHGIGPETADDMLLYAFDRPVFVIDAYTRRLFARLGLLNPDLDYEILRETFQTNLPLEVNLFSEYHALIVIHAKTVCQKNPRCADCCLSKRCRHALLAKA